MAHRFRKIDQRERVLRKVGRGWGDSDGWFQG